MRFLLKLIIITASVSVAAYITPGVFVDSLNTVVTVAIVLGVLNTFVTPVLKLVTFPLTILTLGLFLFVINTFMVLVVEYVVPGFEIDSLLMAFLFSIAVSLINTFLSKLAD